MDGEPVQMIRDEFVASLSGFLGGFTAVDSLTFEVLESRVLAPTELRCRVSLAAVVRNVEGRREWVRGELDAATRRGADSRWRIAAFVPMVLESLVARRTFFHDVTRSAGLAASDESLAKAMEAMSHWYPNGAAAADVDAEVRAESLLDLDALLKTEESPETHLDDQVPSVEG